MTGSGRYRSRIPGSCAGIHRAPSRGRRRVRETLFHSFETLCRRGDLLGHPSGDSLCCLEPLCGTTHLFDRRAETGCNNPQRRRRRLRCLCGPAQIRSAGSERRHRFPVTRSSSSIRPVTASAVPANAVAWCAKAWRVLSSISRMPDAAAANSSAASPAPRASAALVPVAAWANVSVMREAAASNPAAAPSMRAARDCAASAPASRVCVVTLRRVSIARPFGR